MNLDAMSLTEVLAHVRSKGLRIRSLYEGRGGMWMTYLHRRDRDEFHNHGAGWTPGEALMEALTGVPTFKLDDPRNPRPDKSDRWKRGIAGQQIPEVKTVAPSDERKKKVLVDDDEDLFG